MPRKGPPARELMPDPLPLGAVTQVVNKILSAATFGAERMCTTDEVSRRRRATVVDAQARDREREAALE